jgi:hypothetical protein
VQVVGPIGAENVIDDREAKGPAPVSRLSNTPCTV